MRLGIFSLGAGKIVIYNNSVNHSGELGGQTANGMAGIMVDTRYTYPTDSTTFYIYKNRIGSNTDYAIRVYNTYTTFTKNNMVCQNIGNISVASGIKWKECEQDVSANNVSNAEAKTLTNAIIKIFPNPSRDNINVTLPAELEGKIMLSVYDEKGNFMFLKNVTKASGTSTSNMDISKLNNGFYLLQIAGDNYS